MNNVEFEDIDRHKYNSELLVLEYFYFLLLLTSPPRHLEANVALFAHLTLETSYFAECMQHQSQSRAFLN